MKAERIAMRVQKGGLVPADGLSQARLRARNYHAGDVVFIEVKKPRNPKFHRLVHAFGELVVENIEDFAGYDPHRAIKRLQMESGVGCEEMLYKAAGQTILQRIPRSLSFESMEQGEFSEMYTALCRHVAEKYQHIEVEELQLMIEQTLDNSQ